MTEYSVKLWPENTNKTTSKSGQNHQGKSWQDHHVFIKKRPKILCYSVSWHFIAFTMFLKMRYLEMQKEKKEGWIFSHFLKTPTDQNSKLLQLIEFKSFSTEMVRIQVKHHEIYWPPGPCLILMNIYVSGEHFCTGSHSISTTNVILMLDMRDFLLLVP